MKRDMRVLRQGDVLLTPVDSLPPNAVKAKEVSHRVVCQYGEVTGHAHAIARDEVEAYTDTDNETSVTDALAKGARAWLEVCYKADLKHEEHATITLEPGIYEVSRQRQYTPEAIVLVAD